MSIERRSAAAVVMFGLFLVVSLTAACTSSGDGEAEEAGEEVRAFDLELGSCFNSPGASEVKEVMVVDCSEPHGFEIYHSFRLDDGPYPGAEALEQEWIQGCIGPFEEFVGATFDESSLDISAIFPTDESWDQLGDRDVLCSVTSTDGQLRTGSAEGSGV